MIIIVIVIGCSSSSIIALQVLNEHLQMLKKPKDQAKSKGKARHTRLDVQALLLPLELRLVLQGATVKFEHHPMEVSCQGLENLQQPSTLNCMCQLSLSFAFDGVSVPVRLQLFVAITLSQFYLSPRSPKSMFTTACCPCNLRLGCLLMVFTAGRPSSEVTIAPCVNVLQSPQKILYHPLGSLV